MEAFLCLAYLCIYAYNYVPYTYGTRGPTIGVPQHDTKHTMDTSCGTPWNTSTMDVPPGTIHPHLSRRSRDPAPISSLPPATFFFSSLFNVLPFLAILLLPHSPCYRVQGQPIEGNFLLPIASACPPRTIRFVLLFFILERCSFFFYIILSLFSSPSFSYLTEPLYKFEDDEKTGGKAPMEIGSRCIRPSAN